MKSASNSFRSKSGFQVYHPSLSPDTMALSQVVTKTYSRRSRQAESSHAARVFDEVFRPNRPPARTMSTAEKWGNATFSRVSNSSSPVKRKLADCQDLGDPFSFDSDDEINCKKTKKSHSSLPVESKNTSAAGVRKQSTRLKESENKTKTASSREIARLYSTENVLTESGEVRRTVAVTSKASYIVNPTVSSCRTKHSQESSEKADRRRKSQDNHVSNKTSVSVRNGLKTHGVADSVHKNTSEIKSGRCPSIDTTTDKTLQLECYSIMDDDGSDSCDAGFDSVDIRQNKAPKSSTELKSAAQGAEAVSQSSVKDNDVKKCEKQAQVFVSRFARLLASRQSDSSSDKHSENLSKGKLSDSALDEEYLKPQDNKGRLPAKLTTKLVTAVSTGDVKRDLPQSLSDNDRDSSVSPKKHTSRNTSEKVLSLPKRGRGKVKDSPDEDDKSSSEYDIKLLSPIAASPNIHPSSTKSCSSSQSYSRVSLKSSDFRSATTGRPENQMQAVETITSSSATHKLKPSTDEYEQKKAAVTYSKKVLSLADMRKQCSKSAIAEFDEFDSSQQIPPKICSQDSPHLSHSSQNSTSSRRLLSGSRRNTSRGKAVYNPRQWNDPDELVSQSSQLSGSSQPHASAAPESSVFDDFDSVLPSHTTPVVTSGRSSQESNGRTSLYGDPDCSSTSKLMIKRELRPLYAVVHNVKQAHECQEYGEKQEFCDDIDYIMDGLRASQPVATRCLSAISLASKCSASAFRMHIRAHGTLSKVFSALHDAPDFPSLSLCTSAIMFVMSRDHLAMDIDRSSMELMLRLLNVEGTVCPNTDDSSVELDKMRQRIQNICNQQLLSAGRKDKHIKSLTIEDTTAGNLAMETLLSLTSKQAGDWFKEAFRSLGGLEQIVKTVCGYINKLDTEALSDSTVSTPATRCMIKQLQCVDRCVRILESVSLSSSANQLYLFNYRASEFIKDLNRLLQLLIDCLPYSTQSLMSCDDSVAEMSAEKDSANSVMSACLIATLRLLFNITHDNESASRSIGQMDGMMSALLAASLVTPQHLPTSQRFDLLVLGLGLLANLLECSATNRRQFILMKTKPPSDHQYASDELVDSLEALGMMFSSRYEAAKLVEEEQDAEIEEAERHKKAAEQAATVTASSSKKRLDGEWCESDSGLLWNPADASSLDDSDDGLAALQACRQQAAAMSGNAGCSSSQEDGQNYVKVLQTAGKHMEDSIVSAYIALLVGTIVQHNMDLAERVRDTLPGFSFSPMVQMLSKFLGFMNLTTASGASSSSATIQKIIDVLEAC